jgi:hypothetical protein
LVYALAYLEKAGIRHHDFYPTNVYYSSGIFKISNPALQETTAYGLTQQRTPALTKASVSLSSPLSSLLK